MSNSAIKSLDQYVEYIQRCRQRHKTFINQCCLFVFIVNFEHIRCIFLTFLLLTLDLASYLMLMMYTPVSKLEVATAGNHEVYCHATFKKHNCKKLR